MWSFSNVQPSTSPSEKCHSSGTHDAAGSALSRAYAKGETARSVSRIRKRYKAVAGDSLTYRPSADLGCYVR